MRFWQAVTIALLMSGYAGYYLCRSNLSVCLPLLIQEMTEHGIPRDLATTRLGTIASFGVLAYAIGKFPSGGLADFLGGRRNYLFGMAGSVLFTFLFAIAGGIPLFTLAWIGNRAVQSLGWAGVVKIASKWFSFSTYGTVMGVISLSFLFGDALSRQFMSALIAQGFGWREVFYCAGGVLTVLLLVNLLVLRESPRERDLPEPAVNPDNLFREEGEKHRPNTVGKLLRTFGASRVFWLICILSLGMTLVRETFNLWTPTYFTQAVGLTTADAAQKSALFPFFGGISVLLSGFLSDRLGRSGRAAIILCGMILAGAALLALGLADFKNTPTWPVALVSTVAFLIIGPYAYLAGAIALDFGGKQGSGTASGLIDGIGYLGGVLAGNSMANIAVTWGWKGAFAVLAGVTWVGSIAAALYFFHQRRPSEQHS
ncbi:MAG TPA: MFS transporter [Bryobacteraceae bacterium]|nr:MFS transporter [Bryobacteraceae bacterium]